MRTYRSHAVAAAITSLLSSTSGSAAAPQPDWLSTTSPVVAVYRGSPISRGELERFILTRHRSQSARFYFGYDGQRRAIEDMVVIRELASSASEAARQSPDLGDGVAIRFRNFVIFEQQKRLEQVTVPDSALREYYDSNTKDFVDPEKRLVRHIFKEIKEGWSESERADLASTMTKVRERLLAGEDFAALAGSESELESATSGGSIGWITTSSISMKPFVDTAFALEPGTISSLVETPYGIHIIKVEDVKPASQVSFEEVLRRKNLRQTLEDFKRERVKSEYARGLREAAAVTTGTIRPTTATDVLFTANGHDFTLADYLLHQLRLPRSRWGEALASPVVLSDEDLDNLIYGELIAQDVVKSERIPAAELAEARSLIERVIQVDMYLKQMAEAEADTSEEALQARYRQDIGRHRTEESVDVSQIFVDAATTEGMTKAERKRALEKALTRAREAHDALRAGTPFPEVAQRYSTDALGRTGGHVGEVTYGEGGPYLDEAARNTAEGAYSDPVETPNGYLIVMVHKRTPSREKPFETVRDTIRRVILLEAERAIQDRVVEGLVKSGALTINEEMFTTEAMLQDLR